MVLYESIPGDVPQGWPQVGWRPPRGIHSHRPRTPPAGKPTFVNTVKNYRVCYNALHSTKLLVRYKSALAHCRGLRCGFRNEPTSNLGERDEREDSNSLRFCT